MEKLLSHWVAVLLGTVLFATLVGSAYVFDVPYHVNRFLNPSTSLTITPEENQGLQSPSSTLNEPLRSDAEDPLLSLGELEHQETYTDRNATSYASLLVKDIARFRYAQGRLPQFATAQEEEQHSLLSSEFGTTKLIAVNYRWLVSGTTPGQECPVLDVLSTTQNQNCPNLSGLGTANYSEIIANNKRPLFLVHNIEQPEKDAVACFVPNSDFFTTEARRICALSDSANPETLPKSIPSVANEICACLETPTKPCYYCTR